MKKVTACWQVDDNSIVISCPSSKGGIYLIGITVRNDTLCIVHDCPAIRNKMNCWHVKAAIEAYSNWCWWDDITSKKIKSICRRVKLNPNWEQIDIPTGGEADEIRIA